ncbi:MAG: hypothetical protein WCR27_02755 [Eubacteriales bacterium]
MSPMRKQLYASIIVVIFCIVIVCGLGNFRSKQLAINLAGEQVYTVVERAAAEVEPDKFMELVASQSMDHPYYKELYEKFAKLREENKFENIYIMTKNDLGKWYYVIDARSKNNPKFAALGTVEEEIPVAMENAIRGKNVIGDYYICSRGTLVSSFLEIKDTSGQATAVIGADFNAKEMTDYLYLTRYIQIAIISVGALFIGIIAFLSRK